MRMCAKTLGIGAYSIPKWNSLETCSSGTRLGLQYGTGDSLFWPRWPECDSENLWLH